jgi:hypothetical protein
LGRATYSGARLCRLGTGSDQVLDGGLQVRIKREAQILRVAVM